MQISTPITAASATRNVARKRERIKPTILADAFLYVDTIEMISKRRPDIALLTAIREAIGHRAFCKEIVDRDVRWGYRLVVNQPTPEVFPILDQWQETSGAVISRLHFALDSDPRPGVTREELIEWLRRCAHLRYRRNSDEIHEYEGTRYAVRRAGRKTRPSKDLVQYHGKVGKLDGEVDKIHIELRLENARIIRNAKIGKPSDLLNIDPYTLINRYLKFVSVESFIDRSVKITVAQTKPTPMFDIERRVRALFRRLDFDTFTGFKTRFAKQAERMKSLDVLNISNEMHWVPRGVSVKGMGDEVGRLSCLLPPPQTATPRPHKIQTSSQRR